MYKNPREFSITKDLLPSCHRIALADPRQAPKPGSCNASFTLDLRSPIRYVQQVQSPPIMDQPTRPGDLSWRLSSHPITLLCFLGFRTCKRPSKGLQAMHQKLQADIACTDSECPSLPLRPPLHKQLVRTPTLDPPTSPPPRFPDLQAGHPR